MTDRFKVHAVGNDGTQSLVDAEELVITLGDGKELKVMLRNHSDREELTLLTEDSSIVLKPGASNLVRLSLEQLDKSCGTGQSHGI